MTNLLVHGQTCVWIDHVYGHVILEQIAESATDSCDHIDSDSRLVE